MSTNGLEAFDTTIQDSNKWLKAMSGELGSDSRRSAFAALKGVLHAVRDRIGAENAAHLGNQLPMLLRGAYYEAWHPGRTPTHERHLEGFSDHVKANLPEAGDINPAEAARACFAVMNRYLDGGEMRKLMRVLPREVLNLWPDSALRS